jgi:Protein of unknown function (DUF3373)
MQLQNLIVRSMFAMPILGRMPASVNEINQTVANNYANYLQFTNNLTFSQLKAAMNSFPPAMQKQLMGLLMPATYVPGYNANTADLLTNRLRLDFGGHVSDNVSFSARLAMYKVFGDSTGVQIFNGQPTSLSIDGTTSGVPNSDQIRVDRAYFSWNHIADSKFYLSIGSIVDPDSEITGYLPAYITTPGKSGGTRIRPTNLITGVYWFDQNKQRPVFTWQVQQAFFSQRPVDADWTYRPEILKAFADKEGIIDLPQAVYDTPEKIALVRGLLQKYGGVEDPQLRIDITPWAMSHNTVGKQQATKECTACHAKRSILNRAVDLDTYLPKNVPVFYRGQRMDVVSFQQPEPTFDNRILLKPFYVIGNSRVPWIEWFGWLAVAAAAFLGLLHGGLRLIGGRR